MQSGYEGKESGKEKGNKANIEHPLACFFQKKCISCT